jgi:hypothetical protein
MPFIEAPTTFYLGRRYDPDRNRLDDDVVYYDSRDLTTHAVVVGMTGSGKTGLCINMLEEAVLDQIPAIIIDPKGDITNLMLTFPNLHSEDFQPWVNVDDARRAGMDIPVYAADVAQRWQDGLASWGIVPDRLRWMEMVAQRSIYTPGSDAGLPISIVASLKAPTEDWGANEEAIRERINGITTALLALIGINAQPLADREHVLIANILEFNWRQGIDLTMEDIILQVQNPPFNKLGVFPINEYMTEKQRFKLAMDLNNIIASPSFQSWLKGQPLDMKSLLYQPNGRPRISIFYIAHLSDAERMFMITLLLENMLAWMRTLSGTTSLRALLYVDEMFGYFPPYPKNPPTKEPILRLLKQARAFGIGLILATQNPGDLDYKGLSNAGTWFIGRLQSTNDKKRVVAGLRQMATANENMDMDDVEEMIADLPPRVFLMRNVHDDGGPTLVHTRWAMSYLRGPLTRHQVGELMREQRQELMAKIPEQQNGGQWQQHTATVNPNPAPSSLPGMSFNAQQAAPPPPPVQTSQRRQSASSAPRGFSPNPPPLSGSVAQYYLPVRVHAHQAGLNVQATQMVYQPVLVAQAVVRYQDRKASVYTARIFTYHVPDLQQAGLVHWEDYLTDPVDARTIQSEPVAQAVYGDLPPGLTDSSRLTTLKRELVDMLYNTALLTIPFNPDLKIYGSPDEEFSGYQASVQQAAREKRDAEMDKLTQKFADQMDRLEDKLRRKEIELRAEKKEIKDRQREQLYTTGEALLSLWKGRTNYTLSRMSRANRYRSQTKEDMRESYDAIETIEQDMAELEQEYQAQLQRVNEKWAAIAAKTEEHVISPYKKDIQLELFGIGWRPAWYSQVNGQMVLVDAD